jgi:hypothetical protein
MIRSFSRLLHNKFLDKVLNKFLVKDMSIAEAFIKYNITDNKLKAILGYMGLLLDIGELNEVLERSSYNILLIIIKSYCDGAIFPKQASEVIINFFFTNIFLLIFRK